MGDKFVGDLQPDIAIYEEQLMNYNRLIEKVSRKLGRADRKTERAYAKNAKSTRGTRWLLRYDRNLLKTHRLKYEYEHLVAQRNSLRQYVVQLREAVGAVSISYNS